MHANVLLWKGIERVKIGRFSTMCVGMQCSFGLVHHYFLKALHGIEYTPYDANLLLKSAGPFAWIVIEVAHCLGT